MSMGEPGTTLAAVWRRPRSRHDVKETGAKAKRRWTVAQRRQQQCQILDLSACVWLGWPHGG
jgi:hypothetical protein